MSGSLESRLVRYLESKGCQELDAAVLEYVFGILKNTVEDESGEEEENLLHLDGLLAGACGDRYDCVAEEERHQQLLDIVLEVRCNRPASAPSITPDPKPKAPSLGPSASGRPAAPKSNAALLPKNTAPGSDGARGCPSPAVVQELKAFCSVPVSEEFLSHSLARRFHGNAEALAAWLLDTDGAELQAAASEWEARREAECQQEEEARLLKERNKQHILEKFDLRPVAEPKDPKKAARGKGDPALEHWTAKQSQQAAQKVRYLDGRVVSTKGEKFIVEKTGEEWDGGSRGKVYTKGKRGKGFM